VAPFFAQPLHQPAAATLFPGKSLQPAMASPALPSNSEQFPQVASGFIDFEV
jgi:hypothetical protein